MAAETLVTTRVVMLRVAADICGDDECQGFCWNQGHRLAVTVAALTRSCVAAMCVSCVPVLRVCQLT
jgi:hypothetical protein